MAVPKKRQSKAKTNTRKNNWKKKAFKQINKAVLRGKFKLKFRKEEQKN